MTRKDDMPEMSRLLTRRRRLSGLAILAASALVIGFVPAVLPGPLPAVIAATAAYLWLAAISVVLTGIDIEAHRLPDAIVLPAYLISGGLLALAGVLGAGGEAIVRAVIGMAALFTFYLALRLLQPSAMGGGDVKLAGVIGLHLGFVGWDALVVGAVMAFFLGGLYGVILLLIRRANRRTAIPFGPWMLAGAWVGIIGGPALAALLLR